MVAPWVMLGGEVRQVVLSRFPIDMEMALSGPVAEPVEAHVHCLGSLLFDCVIDDPLGRTVVSLERGGRLRMP